MVRVYKRKTDRVNIDENDMKNAISAVLRKTLSERAAAAEYNISRPTLQSRLRMIRKANLVEKYMESDDSGLDEDNMSSNAWSKYGSRQFFKPYEEMQLVEYIKTCSNMNYGLTYDNIRSLAYQFALIIDDYKAKITPKWHEEKKAGLPWLQCFMTRHSKFISLRKPESTSLARATAFNKVRVAEYFSILENVLEKGKFSPHRIWNLDETSIHTVMRPVRVVAPTGKKQVGCASSAERGELSTIIGIINAAGGFLPPVYVFPRIRDPEGYLITGNCVTSSLAMGTSNGWSNSEIFLKTLGHIKRHTKCSKDDQILLILDNHESHINVNAINYCRDNGIVMLTFPPHTSHRMQPLDVAVFGPFKNYCAAAFNNFMATNPGQRITLRQIGHLTKGPFLDAFSAKNITKGFKKTGIFPFDTNMFGPEDFLPAAVTDQPLDMANLKSGHPMEFPPSTSTVSMFEETPANQQALSNVDFPSTSSVGLFEETPANQRGLSNVDFPPTSSVDMAQNMPANEQAPLNVGFPFTSLAGMSYEASPSQQHFSTPSTHNSLSSPASSGGPTPEQARPFPKYTRQRPTSVRQGKAAVYTSTPEKDRLVAIEEERAAKKKVGEEKRKKKFMKILFPEEAKKKTLEERAAKKKEAEERKKKAFVNGLLPDEAKKKTVKKAKKRARETDSESDDCKPIVLKDFSTDGEFVSSESDGEELAVEPDTNPQLNVGDFYIVQFEGKQQKKFYIGKMEACTTVMESCTLKFMRKHKSSGLFVWPTIDDIGQVEVDQLYKRVVGTSARRGGGVFFSRKEITGISFQ